MTRIALALLVAFATACGDTTPSAVPGPPPVQVTVATAAVQSLPQLVELGGVIQPRRTATVASRMMAPIRDVRVVAGDRVRAGDILVLLDSRDIDALARRAAALEVADQHAVGAAEADRDAAQVAVTLARAAHQRVSQLRDAGAATAHEFDQATAALQAAEARHASSVARVAAAGSALAVSREASAAAAVTASFATLTAPFDGVVAERLVDPGDLAAPGVPLLRIEDTGGFRLEVRVDESQVGWLGPRQAVEVAAGSDVLAGRVAEIGRSIEDGAHTFTAKIDVPAAPGLRTGLFARARIAVPAREALSIPASAIVSRGQLPTVFVVTGERARMRVVRTGAPGAVAEVLAGLAPGERVVVAPPPSLRDGDLVQAAPPPAGGS